MHSDDKLLWFYRVGAEAMLVVAIVLQVGSFFVKPAETSQLNTLSRWR